MGIQIQAFEVQSVIADAGVGDPDALGAGLKPPCPSVLDSLVNPAADITGRVRVLPVPRLTCGKESVLECKRSNWAAYAFLLGGTFEATEFGRLWVKFERQDSPRIAAGSVGIVGSGSKRSTAELSIDSTGGAASGSFTMGFSTSSDWSTGVFGTSSTVIAEFDSDSITSPAIVGGASFPLVHAISSSFTTGGSSSVAEAGTTSTTRGTSLSSSVGTTTLVDEVTQSSRSGRESSSSSSAQSMCWTGVTGREVEGPGVVGTAKSSDSDSSRVSNFFDSLGVGGASLGLVWVWGSGVNTSGVLSGSPSNGLHFRLAKASSSESGFKGAGSLFFNRRPRLERCTLLEADCLAEDGVRVDSWGVLG